jgi:hypothetical protein
VWVGTVLGISQKSPLQPSRGAEERKGGTVPRNSSFRQWESGTSWPGQGCGWTILVAQQGAGDSRPGGHS